MLGTFGTRLFYALAGGVQLAFAVVEARSAVLAWDLVRGGGPGASLALAAQDAWYGALAPLGLLSGLVLLVLAARQRLRPRGVLLFGWTLLSYAGVGVGLWLSGPTHGPEAMFLGALFATEGGLGGVISAVVLGAWTERRSP